MNRPRLLDLFCCQGGAAMGYHRAGFDVVGVDIADQPRFPFEFHRGDALEYLAVHGDEFDVVHASPPCQAHTLAQRIRGNEHPDLVATTRDALVALGVAVWVIENVPGAPLREHIELCGSMFGLETYRHRWFESSVSLVAPPHGEHVARTTKMGRPVKEGEYMHIVGNFSGVPRARRIMDMPWASREGLREAIPPSYTEYLGRQLIAFLERDDGALSDS